MTKAQKTQRRQSRHDRQVARRIEKKQALAVRAEVPDGEEADLEEGDELEDLPLEEEVEETEDSPTPDESEELENALPVRKDYMGEMAMQPMSGPTSWDELDA